MATPLDPRLVFDRFVVGPGNRLAAVAARRVAEAPGRSYNPLLITAPAGCGKTHLLVAIGNLARAVQPGLRVRYETAEQLVDRLSESIAEGRVEALRDAIARSGLWLLDDLGALVDRPRSQEELLRVWEELIPRGGQMVAAVDRPLADLPGLDPRLAERLAGGLAVEIAPPDARERLALARRAVGERGVPVPDEVVGALSRLPLESARAVLEAVDRVVATVELEGRAPEPERLPALLGLAEAPPRLDEFGALVADVSAAVAAVVETSPWRRRLAEAILRWEGEAVLTRRLDQALDADSAPDVDALLRAFARDVARMREVARALPVPPDDPALLTDPDRLPELERHAATAPGEPPAAESVSASAGVRTDPWFLDRERFDWGWVALEDRLLEEQR